MSEDIDEMLTEAISHIRSLGANCTVYSEALKEIRRLRKVEAAARYAIEIFEESDNPSRGEIVATEMLHAALSGEGESK